MAVEVDDRRAGNSDVGSVVTTAERRGHRGSEVARREHRPALRIECVHRVVFGHDIQHVVHAAGNGLSGHQERLRIDLIVERHGAQHAKVRREGRRGQHRLRLVPAGPQGVVVIGGHCDSRARPLRGGDAYQTSQHRQRALRRIHDCSPENFCCAVIRVLGEMEHSTRPPVRRETRAHLLCQTGVSRQPDLSLRFGGARGRPPDPGCVRGRFPHEWTSRLCGSACEANSRAHPRRSPLVRSAPRFPAGENTGCAPGPLEAPTAASSPRRRRPGPAAPELA